MTFNTRSNLNVQYETTETSRVSYTWTFSQPLIGEP